MTVFQKNNAVEGVLYAMYLRKSRADIELEAISKEETLARHKDMLYALAERHNILPHQIVVYHEIVSGDSLDDRPEAQRLLKDVYNGKYKAVLVVEVERLARGNTKDQGEVADAFSFSHTHIITPAKVYDPDNEFDQEYFEFGLFMARREYKTIRRRLDAGKLQAVREGNYILPNPPYGFDVVRKSKKDRYLVEKPEESRIVKMIFDWCTEDGKTADWIAKQLTLMGIPTSSGKREWSRSTVREMLFNAHYIGMVTWGRQKTVREKDHVTGKVVKRAKRTGVVQMFKGKHDGFISEEQFAKVKDIYSHHNPVRGDIELVNPLAGILVCARCGKAIRYQTYPDNRQPRYFHVGGVHACKMKSLPAGIVIEALLKALYACIENFEIELETGSVNSEADRQQAIVEAMEAELAKQQRMKKRLFESWEADDGTYTREEFLERKQMYNHKIESLQAEITEAKKHTPAPIDYAERITNLHAVIGCLSNQEISVDAKNVFLKQVIAEIRFDVIDLGRGWGGTPVLDVVLK